MKIIRLFPAALAMLVASSLHAADPASPTAQTQVIFEHPEKFTDVKDGSIPTDKGRDEILSRIRTFLVDRAASLLPAGDTLAITFTDIDLAGDFEPWRGSRWSDVRIVKSIYPPEFKFTFAVRDASGRAVKQGAEDIRDMNFDMRVVGDSNDTLRYEKDILSDWARSTLRDLK
jgi:hypothetical protein